MSAATQLFASQSSVASDLQLRAVGISARRQHTMVRLGVWASFSPGVIGVAGVAPTWKQRATAATLSPGARMIALAAGPAARLHLLDGCLAVDDVKVVVVNSANPRTAPDVTVLRSRRLTEDDTMFVDGIRVTTVAVTLSTSRSTDPTPRRRSTTRSARAIRSTSYEPRSSAGWDTA